MHTSRSIVDDMFLRPTVTKSSQSEVKIHSMNNLQNVNPIQSHLKLLGLTDNIITFTS